MELAMSVTYSTTVKTARMTAVRDQIDAGGSNGRLEICSAGYASILATVTLGYSGSSTGTISGSVLTLAGFPRSDVSADATGTAAVARVRTSASADVITGLTVGTSGTDVVLDSVGITSGQVITINSATFTHG
jgi:hypothetical protein